VVTGDVAQQTIDIVMVWEGDVDWRTTRLLREALFDGLEVPGRSGVQLDLQGVTSIDRCGIALLIGANFRASAVGRRLALVVSAGPVISALEAHHVLGDFDIRLELPSVGE
jgi:anti-anti-sigma factor